MKKSHSLLLAAAVLVAAIAGCVNRAPQHSTEPMAHAGWEAGMAEIDITPPIGFRMAGYFDERLSTGEHDPLKAKAMVLQDGTERVAFVFCDLVGMSLHVTRPARERASRLTGIPVTNIIVAATHSHTGPLFDDVRRDDFHQAALKRYGRDPQEKIDYPKFLTDQIVKVIVDANKKVAPAELDTGIAHQTGMPFNRRSYMKDGRVVFNPGRLNPNIDRPAGPVDSDVGMLVVKNPKTEKPVGGLTVFAMHADTIGLTEFSADYPYFIQQTLRGKLGSNYISAFGAGTCGDLNHIDNAHTNLPIKGYEVSSYFGTNVGNTVLQSLPDLKPIEHPSLAVRDEMLMLPLQPVTPREVAEALLVLDRIRDTNMNFYLKVKAVKWMDLSEKGKIYPMEVQVFRLNEQTAVVFLPAEIFVEFGLAIKKASPFKETLVIALSNDRPSYVPTLKAFSEGSYEVINSRLAPGGGEVMVETAIGMLNDLKRGL